jgi:hypothetical protein
MSKSDIEIIKGYTDLKNKFDKRFRGFVLFEDDIKNWFEKEIGCGVDKVVINKEKQQVQIHVNNNNNKFKYTAFDIN